jgi:hypothetical protein
MSLRIFLSREITVEVFGQRTTRTTVLGEATFRALPPVTLQKTTTTLRDESEVLDWEGEVRCAEDISTGGFFTETLVVRVSPLDLALPPRIFANWVLFCRIL